MRGTVVGLVLAVATAGCTWQSGPTSVTTTGPELQVRPTPSEFARVTAGPVDALVPPGWRAVPTGVDGPRQGWEGFVASPRPSSWSDLAGETAGLSATWVDATRVGVPSDFYYLAATGPMLSRLLASERCRTLAERIYVDNEPAYASGWRRSPGDYIARGEGVCGARARATRWAYFVAAPGLGPARQVGIPSSGLYVVVAVAPESPAAGRLLQHLMAHTHFGDATIGDFVRATRTGVAP